MENMKLYSLLFALTIFLSSTSKADAQSSIEGYEIGFDGFFGASNFGGSFGIGPKFGFVMNENLVVGPSFRFQRSWSSPAYAQQGFSYNNYGGGFFVHGRYNNIVFGGVEAEVLYNQNTLIDTSAVFKKAVPTVFICAGFSREFAEIVRINAGIYYDVVNSVNSPYRNSYFLTVKDAATGQVVRRIPLMYRISFFFPLGKKKKKAEEEVESD
ncbi:MAG: hypothetical protein V4638_04885 [Bacteroidota bacterium]